MPNQTNSNIYELGTYRPEEMLDEIRDLRERIVSAWRERAVMLTREEQNLLYGEIKETCRLLNDLTP